MKKFAIAFAIVAMLPVAASAQTTVCSGGGAANGTPIESGDDFVKARIVPKCSANVFLTYAQNTTAFWVGAGSSKGKSYFGGSTEGGAVANLGGCDATGCSETNAESALSAAATACGSACQ